MILLPTCLSIIYKIHYEIIGIVVGGIGLGESTSDMVQAIRAVKKTGPK
jgi:L-asparaginase/Glu-tRNA(Gln) amidotransferase subunit D